MTNPDTITALEWLKGSWQASDNRSHAALVVREIERLCAENSMLSHQLTASDQTLAMRNREIGRLQRELTLVRDQRDTNLAKEVEEIERLRGEAEGYKDVAEAACKELDELRSGHEPSQEPTDVALLQIASQYDRGLGSTYEFEQHTLLRMLREARHCSESDAPRGEAGDRAGPLVSPPLPTAMTQRHDKLMADIGYSPEKSSVEQPSLSTKADTATGSLQEQILAITTRGGSCIERLNEIYALCAR